MSKELVRLINSINESVAEFNEFNRDCGYNYPVYFTVDTDTDEKGFDWYFCKIVWSEDGSVVEVNSNLTLESAIRGLIRVFDIYVCNDDEFVEWKIQKEVEYDC